MYTRKKLSVPAHFCFQQCHEETMETFILHGKVNSVFSLPCETLEFLQATTKDSVLKPTVSYLQHLPCGGRELSFSSNV